jgi:hypothetical protein
VLSFVTPVKIRGYQFIIKRHEQPVEASTYFLNSEISMLFKIDIHS